MRHYIGEQRFKDSINKGLYKSIQISVAFLLNILNNTSLIFLGNYKSY